jgi:hypothetical protein
MPGKKRKDDRCEDPRKEIGAVEPEIALIAKEYQENKGKPNQPYGRL